MMASEAFKAIFIGFDTVTICWLKPVYNEKGLVCVHARKSKGFFGKRWVPLLNNFHKSLLNVYQERVLLTIEKGRTDTKVRIFDFDIDRLQPNMGRLPVGKLAELESAQVEAGYHKSVATSAKEFTEASGNSDLYRKRVKSDVDFHRGLNPSRAPSSNVKGGVKK